MCHVAAFACRFAVRSGVAFTSWIGGWVFNVPRRITRYVARGVEKEMENQLREELQKLFWDLEQLCLTEHEWERNWAIQMQKSVVKVALMLGVRL